MLPPLLLKVTVQVMGINWAYRVISPVTVSLLKFHWRPFSGRLNHPVKVKPATEGSVGAVRRVPFCTEIVVSVPFTL